MRSRRGGGVVGGGGAGTPPGGLKKGGGADIPRAGVGEWLCRDDFSRGLVPSAPRPDLHAGRVRGDGGVRELLPRTIRNPPGPRVPREDEEAPCDRMIATPSARERGQGRRRRRHAWQSSRETCGAASPCDRTSSVAPRES